MTLLLNALIVLAAFAAMEFMAWFTHKYVMHGPLWFLHKDHHTHEAGFFERNDAFFLIFAIPAWLLIMYGMMAGNDFRVWIGAGIAVYGFTYFMVHDVFIHQRFKLFRKANHPYLRAIRKAHHVHHRNKGQFNSTCFGMLVVPRKFMREEVERAKRQPRSVSTSS